jgi:hypothetical protein
MLMIVASCDILQDTFPSVTELSRPVRELSVGYAHVMGCIILLYVRVESSPSVGCAHVMGVSFSFVWELSRCGLMPLYSCGLS